MKYLQRACCLLCSLVLLSAVFSINAHAKSNVVQNLRIKVNAVMCNYSTCVNVGTKSYNVGSGEYMELSHSNGIIENTKAGNLHATYTFSSAEILKSGKEANVEVKGLLYYVMYKNSSVTYIDSLISSARVLLFYEDGDMEYVDDVTYEYSNGYNFSFKCTPKEDVNSFEIITQNQLDSDYQQQSSRMSVTLAFGESDSYPLTTITVEQESKEEGLLGGILEWVKGIKNKVDDTFNSITDGFSNIGTWFAELPSKIWTLISDGLKSLFVPSEEFIVQFREDMDLMLEDKLGAVYQVVNLTLESWDRISASDKQNTINLPQTTINLPEGNLFSFGGYDVQIVPSGFDMLANAIKLIGGICCTILFINGLRRRYDEVLGGE